MQEYVYWILQCKTPNCTASIAVKYAGPYSGQPIYPLQMCIRDRYETDALPVGGGGMFTENALALLALVAVSIAGGAGAGAFAAGVGKLLGLVTFGGIQQAYGTALGFGVFVVIVLTMVQLVFRVMRVTLGEWLGDVWLGFKNPHISACLLYTSRCV